MSKRFKIGGLNMLICLRHRWDDGDQWELTIDGYALGIWFRTYKIVGSKNFNTPSEWKNNYITSYDIGFNFLVGKVWVNFDWRGKHL
jgi:hypothetical protein